jgi:hypothetical protein
MRPRYEPGSPRMIVEAYQTMQLRCLCPECLRLDARHPEEGYQLALFAYRRQLRPRA